MPWKRTEPMDQKIQMIGDWLSNSLTKTDLSKKYGISRKTVVKWTKRYNEKGADGLKEKSREPINKPNATEQELIERIIQYKIKHKKRGPKKLYKMLEREYPGISWPCASTIGYWLKKYNLVEPRKRIKRVPPYTEPFIKCANSNDVWSADYKGQFGIKNGKQCYPLTISDNYSRFLIDCAALEGPKYIETREVFEKAFREYGLPLAIRTDNGTPFCSKSISGLSRLSMWWIQLGIIPERIDKGCPAQNGRHERMHRTLKFEVLDTVAKNIKEQQKRFDEFVYEYNNNRPHESLEQKRPVDYYCPSNRTYIEKKIKPFYDYDYEVRQVKSRGAIKFKGELFYLSQLLYGEPIGLKQVNEECWDIYYYWANIGILDLKQGKIFSKQV